MKFWFTADYHFGHKNIIEYCKRPFKDVNHMNEVLIKNHNSKVRPEDVVFFLGDFCINNFNDMKNNKAGDYLRRMNGRFIFVKGNHDNKKALRTVIESISINLGGHEIFLVHNPEDYDGYYKICFVGHVHQAWKFKRCYDTDLINVGCDVWNYMPICIEEILNEYKKWKMAGKLDATGNTDDRFNS